uniref:Uncharacterized protein n=1 Tax=Anopheles farauti TaxID=69004 RepID=A0A182QF39_9DIPT
MFETRSIDPKHQKQHNLLTIMAKLGLLFVVIFCIIQITLAARLRRDVIEDGISGFKQTISDTFTKENVDNFFNKLSEFGETFKTKTSEIGETIAKKVNEAVN